MASSTIWASGRYDAVGDRIAPIADEVVDAALRRVSLPRPALIDLACGTGSAALAASAKGAQVTGLDFTQELVEIAAQRDGANAVTWRTGDASDTGLPAGSFDAVVSNMGIIFVDPDRQVVELARLLKTGGVLAFSAWVRNASNPFFDPVVAVLGPPAATGFSPDQWADPEILAARLGADFDSIDIVPKVHRWKFESMTAALRFLRDESPVHVATFGRADAAQRDELTAAFESAMREHLEPSGAVAFDAPYVVASAVRA